MLLPLIFLFQMAFTFKTLIVPFLVHYFHHNMCDWLERLRHLLVFNDDDSIVVSHRKQHFEVLSNCLPYIIILATFSVAPPWPIIKRAEYLKYTLQHQCTSKIITKDDLWSIHASRRLTCHHYDHQLSLVIQVHGDSKHQAQPMNQSLVAAINAATSYKPIVDPFWQARSYNHIQSGLTLPLYCLLTCMLACISIIMIFTTIILIKSMQYRLSSRHVMTNSSPEQLTGKHTKMNHYQTKRKV